MKLKRVRILNYRSCRDVTLDLAEMHALVGANNAGKSCILRAMDFLFNPSATRIDSETFWNSDETSTIRVEAELADLTEAERTGTLQPYLREDGTLRIARTAKVKAVEAGSEDEGKIAISQQYCRAVPRYEWLQGDVVSAAKIDGWWPDRATFVAGGASFADALGSSKPKVGDWKAKAADFAAEHLGPDEYEEKWIENPAGYSGVLKGALPQFIFVPAVRDLADEAKATKSNPFGRLLYALINQVAEEERAALDGVLARVRDSLNRAGGEQRLSNITEMEKRLNEILSDYMSADLEVEFQAPTLDVLFTTPRLHVDDGFRNLAENKGHGLQRSIIFTILRYYSELVSGQAGHRTRSVIFAVEEPEIYMHPQAQRTIRRVFGEIAAACDQVLFSTHSSLLVDVARFDEVIRVEKVATRQGDSRRVETRVHQLPMQALLCDIKARHPKASATDQSLRDIYANAYHPNRAEGFFASKVILVEGATEHYALPIYAAALGIQLDGQNIAIVDCGGKGQMDRLYRVFNELGIPSYVVFDYDQGSSDSNVKDKSRELLSLLGADPNPPASLLVTDRVACFPEKWETQMRCEVDRYDQRVGAARAALGISDDTGKPLVARWIARELTREPGGACPGSMRLVLEAAVAVEHHGTCLKRLDEQSGAA